MVVLSSFARESCDRNVTTSFSNSVIRAEAAGPAREAVADDDADVDMAGFVKKRKSSKKSSWEGPDAVLSQC